ncbi:fasciclin domain-containing protein [Oceanihabitans sp. IOP_32]|uniref:fasciclin domain-containing protein n=1 Tax=Oceanihabitans sp. IOP_32 TaxID=2529032 RepID=UPI0012933ACF|nr:fasciclin domain-containing protein [Oceanihabitans sp. IOP_32]QFZ55291.1 fasciclin domain-containing protein [Oceanihabitans sp. IOP_32]
MKTLTALKKVVLLAVITVFAFSCDDDDNPIQVPQTKNIVELAQGSPTLSNLVAALQAADGDLVSVLSGTGPFTVLAPTDEAFAAFLDDNNFATLADVPAAVLTQILLNHVITGKTMASDLIAAGAGYTSTNAAGPGESNLSLYFNTSSGVVFNGISTVDTPDIEARNGVIHIVDKVIGLPTVVTFATADPNFSTLVSALTTLTPATDFVATLSTPFDTAPAPFTVFAPTNDAFAKLAAVPAEPVLTQVLLHHVIGEANVRSADLTPNGDTTAATLQGDSVTITLPGTNGNIADMTDGAGNTGIGITAVDVQASNGVIHVIDTVLLPTQP